MRALYFATGLMLAALAFGGTTAVAPDIAMDAAAECVYVDEVGCLPNAECVVAAALEAASGKPFACTL